MKKWHIALLGCVVAGIAAYIFYNSMESRYETRLTKALKEERDEFWDKIGILEKSVAELEEELAQHQEAIVPREKLVEVFGESPEMPSPKKTAIDCEELRRQVMAFFTYLDKKAYVKAYDLEGGTYGLFTKVVKQLSENPPLVSGEMQDMVSLTRNVAHFYRVLGGKPVSLLKEVMENEPAILEPVMASFYAWFNACERCSETGEQCPSLDVLYQYAGFFLNTLGGKSYLSRRDSKVRVLTSYYCVLILNKANQATINRHGIDIRHFIYYLFYDISNQKGLLHKKAYLDKLDALRADYNI